MDATISEASEGRSDVVDATVPEVTDPNTEVKETASAETQSEGRADDVAPDDSGDKPKEDNAEQPLSVESLQKELADFKAVFTKKSQKGAESERLLTVERDEAMRQVDQLTGIVKNILQDQNAADTYREQMGINQQAVPIEVPELKTNEQLQEFLGKALLQIREEVLQQAKQEALQSSTQTVEQASRQNRWLNAQKSLSTNQLFADNLDLINKLVESKFAREYTGNNELEVYQKALSFLEAPINEAKTLGEQKALASLQKKKGAATNVPRKTITTSNQKTVGRKRSVEEIIAAVDARIPVT